jgi:hypothetical protein
MKSEFSKILLLSAFVASSTLSIWAQETKEQKQPSVQAAIRALVESQHYAFEAQSAIPLGMPARQLTYGYELKISKDSVIAYLPYYGRAYTAPIGSTDNAIQFSTTDFKYTASEGKKGGWTVTITPKNTGDVRQITISISQAGYTNVQVNGNNRQPISFYGYIK